MLCVLTGNLQLGSIIVILVISYLIEWKTDKRDISLFNILVLVIMYYT